LVRGLLAQLFCLGHVPGAHGLYGPGARRVELPAPQPLANPAEAAHVPPPAAPSVLEPAALEALPHAHRLEALERFVRAHLAHLLRVPPSAVGLHTPLRDLGLDSLMLSRFRHALEVGIGQPLSMTLVWLFPTAAALAAQLLRQLGLDQAGPPARQAPTAPASSPASPGFNPVEVDSLSEAEAEALLLQTLDFIEV
jgi:polyketide synthase 2/polyketide synthase 5